MHRVFNYKTLALAVASMTTSMLAQAAGLDRSGQDVTAFFQEGTYGEAVYTYIDADVSGRDNNGSSTGDIAESYDFFRFGVKADVNDRFSVGIIYDEPFGAAVEYPNNDNNFVSSKDATVATFAPPVKNGIISNINAQITALNNAPNASNNPQIQGQIQALNLLSATVNSIQDSNSLKQVVAGLRQQQQLQPAMASQLETVIQPLAQIDAASEATDGQHTNVEIRTNNVAALVGVKLGTNKNFQIYGGPAAQRLSGEVHLRGNAYQGATGYDAKLSTDQAMGWVAGVAYSKPEIALRAALTYRSEIDHKTSIAEVFPALALRNLPTTTTRDFKVTLPESYNLDFQTGINPTTLLTAKVRYVPWSDFDIRPTTYTEVTNLPIVSYSKDQWSAEVGLGKKITDRLAVSGSVGYDSGAGDPVSTLGPIEGYYSVGLGAKYNVTPEWSVSVGGKYLKFGDATAQLPTNDAVGKFEDNDGFIVGAKIAYQGK